MIIDFLKRKKTPPPQTPVIEKKYAIAKTGKELLLPQKRAVIIKQIKRLFSITEEIWTQHYLYAIEQFAELVQEVPASEIHHHSTEGGLIDHTLEALHAGTRIAQGHILPPNSEPEQIAASSDRWRFGAFIAILAHDIGKVVTDIEIVYRVSGGEFQHWHPWYGNIPPLAEYSYRYKKRANNAKLAKSLHEKAAMSLLPKLLTKKAAMWLFEDVELLNQLFSTVTHSTFGGQAIAEIVRTADSSSVSKNLGATTGTNTEHSSSIPLHEKLIVSLRKLINDGDLKKNKPGAAIWVTEQDTWAVSKATMEAVRIQLVNEGHKGIPKNTVRLFEVLKEHELLVPNIEGDSVWYAEINDFAKNWQQKLTFLRFKNEIIWPTSNPDQFDGQINPIDKDGNPISEPTETAKTQNDSDIVESTLQVVAPENSPQQQELDISISAPVIKTETVKVATKKEPTSDERNQNAINTPIEAVEPPNLHSNDNGITSDVAKGYWKHSRKVQEDILSQNEFIAWLLRGISRRNIRVNEAKAPVHVLEKHIALVTPAIFNLYLDKNSLKKKLYEKRAGDKKVYTLLQKELEAFDIHQRGQNGQNIVKVSVEGARTQAELRVYLLNRDCFPSLSNFQPNKAIKIHL